MQIAKRFLLAFISMNLVACSTIRLNYEAKVKNEKEETAHFSYQRSYKITASAIVCGVSAIFYGGWCWSYLFRPFTNDVTNIATDASEELEKKHPGFKVINEHVTKEGWSGGSAITDFEIEAPLQKTDIGKP